MKVRRIDFSPDEFLVGTRDLSDAEVGLYWRACSLIYSHGGPVEIAELERWSSGGRWFKRALKRLIEAGKLTLDGASVSNQRCIRELSQAYQRGIRAASNGAQGGRPSKKINGVENPEVSSRANHQPSTSKKDTTDADASVATPTPAEPIPFDPVKEVFDRGVAMLGGRRSLLGQLVRDYGAPAVIEAIEACEAERPVNPASFLVACLKRSSTPKEVNGHGRRSPAEKLYAGAFAAAQEWDRCHGDSGLGEPPAVPLLDRR